MTNSERICLLSVSSDEFHQHVIIIIIDIYIAHIAEASRRLETEGGVEMT